MDKKDIVHKDCTHVHNNCTCGKSIQEYGREYYERIYKEAVRQDQSLPVLQDLLSNGYDSVKWISSITLCQNCQNLNGTTWQLSDFISGLSFNAPIFEKSHPNCQCSIEVTGPGKDLIVLDYRGIINL